MADKKTQQQNPQFSINVNPENTRILFTDSIFMNTNEDGVVLDVAQKVGGTNQMQIVSRIGMSREHAKKFIKKLSELLALTEGSSQTGNKN
jgi:hypothetical protein